MNLENFLEIMDSGKEIIAGSKEHKFMQDLSQEALKITMELNNKYHTVREIQMLMEKLKASLCFHRFIRIVVRI